MTSASDTITDQPGTDDLVTGLRDEDILSDRGARATAVDDQDGTDPDTSDADDDGTDSDDDGTDGDSDADNTDS